MVSEKQKRHRQKIRKRKKYLIEEEPLSQKKTPKKGLARFYYENYKPLFLITVLMLLFSLAVIGVTYAKTGDIIYKGVSLSGGLTITIGTEEYVNPDALEENLAARFPNADIIVRQISELGTQTGLVIEASTSSGSQESLGLLEDEMLLALEESIPNVQDRASTEIIGPSLGQSFFSQVFRAVLIAFTFMGMVVFLYFGENKTQKAIVVGLTLLEGAFIWYVSWATTLLAIIVGAMLIWYYFKYSIPSAAVILAAVSTILFTVAVVDLFQIRISTAGIAAFLMLIGYSVDTDILLSTRVLKRSGSLYERFMGTVKTGLTMELTTMAAAIVALIFSQSDVIKEIMLIIVIGLFADIFFTWIQNVGILRWYLEKRGDAG